MALDRLTKVDGGGISTTSDYRVGIITASKFVGPIEGDVTGSITATDGTFSGNVTIGGTLTYEDVTNIDSVGIITARDGIHVGAGVSAVGVGTFSGLDISGDIDVDGHTNLDNVSIAGVTTVANDTEFIIGSNANNKLPLKIKHDTISSNDVNYIDGRFTYFRSHAIRFYDQDNTSQQVAYFWPNQIGLHANNSEKLQVTNSGVNILNGNLSVSRDIDVDGHTNLDNVSVSGISTFGGSTQNTMNVTHNSGYAIRVNRGSRNLDFNADWGNSGNAALNAGTSGMRFYYGASSDGIQFNTGSGADKVRIAGSGNVSILNDLDVDGHTNLDNVSIAGVTSTTDNIHINADNKQLKIGAHNDGDMLYYHDGNKSVIVNYTGDFHIRSNNGSRASLEGIILKPNGATQLHHSGSKKLETASTGANVIGNLDVINGHVYINDNYKAYFGTSNNLEVYHTGTDGYVKETNGDLWLQSTSDDIIIRAADNISIQAQNGEYCINGNGNGSVDLYYDGGTYSTPKLSTTATGITVDGEVASSQNYPNIRPLLDFNFAATKKLDTRLDYIRKGVASFTDEFGKVVLVGDNTPRFDHDPITKECRGLLIEESRTNRIYPSSNFSTTYWTNQYSNIIEESNTTDTEDPVGTFTATKETTVQGNSSIKSIYWGTTFTFTNGTKFTMSIFAKSTTGLHIQVRPRGQGSGKAWATFNLTTGVVGNSGGSTLVSTRIEKYPNDWYRCSLTFTGSGNTSGTFGFLIMDDGNDGEGVAHTGDSSKSIFIWGAQFETGPSATSYIPTSSAAVTREQDFLVMTGTDLDDIFNPTEGTMFYEASVTDLTNDNQPIVAFRDASNTAASYHAMGHAIGGSPGNVRTWARDASSNNIHLTAHSGLVADTPYKHIYGYKYNDYSDAFTQGTNSAQTNTTSGNYSMNAAGLVDELRFGAYYTDLTTYNLESGHIKRFSYWPQKLTNTQLTTYIS